ncbi:hypothetical protein F511_33951 [Dorcoceras hygrometricum]|uniref:Uncharacterized protein n=1 Tax=Dorcoceras hygrometricum TaxID=472368 RepID=A0A2Z7CCI3_9LAMI|nr:hypothetical protein F511_33951 [Dorcoceras hygrometricum]
MGNADPNKTKAGNKYEVKPHPSQLGGRHSYPVVTAPTIALDFSGTTYQSASHNVAPNQALATKPELKSQELLTRSSKESTAESAHETSNFTNTQKLLGFLNSLSLTSKLVPMGRASLKESSAAKNVKNRG